MKWEGLEMETTGRNTGTPFACPSYPIKSIQVLGTFGGAVCTIQGSNMGEEDTLTYDTLHTPQGIVMTYNDVAIRQVQENTYWVRPSVTGGDGTTDIDVWLLCVTER